MKTTIDIADQLLQEATRLAAHEGVTFDALVERGLRHVLAEDEEPRNASFSLRRASFKGAGLQSGVSDATWEGLRDLAYGVGSR
jgi:hypothetical protein